MTGKIVTLEVESEDTIKSIMRKYSEREGKPMEWIRLSYKGKRLGQNEKLCDHDIVAGTTIFDVFILKLD